MKVIGIKENQSYAGFTLTDNIAEEYDNYAGTPLEVVVLGEGEDEVARNLVDYFTGGSNNYAAYGLVDAVYTLTPEGSAYWDSLNQ